MKSPKYTIAREAGGEDYEIIRDGGVIAYCGTRQMADDLVRDFQVMGDTIASCREDCRMALAEEWDRSDDGFKAQLDHCDDALQLVGWEVEDEDEPIDPFTRDFRGTDAPLQSTEPT